ncbi:MAG TPA: protoporphyrinogen oxidase [Oceanithermus profundus]|uniref:Coproporphyrinogen III oxidase n=1 Tax=Oceanithermus profundus TaxID=187137 RepID=A0A7C4Z6N4_9DEIN|nr:protoporphyrinogen oxidase [Oceanithermus profundus]
MNRVAVVGGGMAGLAAAHELDRRAAGLALPLEVVLFEAEPRLGGKVRTVRAGPYRLEAGPDAVVRYKPWFLELVRELGLSGDVVGTQPARPAALIVKGGRGHPLPEGLNVVIPSKLGPLVRTPLLSPLGKLRAALDLFLPRGPEGDEPFGAFVQRRLGREVWENLAAPLTGGIYGGDPYELSTLAAFPMLKDLEKRHRSLILGSLHAMRKRRGSREGGSLFASLRGGLGRVVEALTRTAERVGWRPNAPVERLEHDEGRWRLYGPWGSEGFDALVLAAPAHAAGELLGPLDPQLAALLREIPYGDTATVTLAFAEEPFPKVSGHGVLVAAGEGSRARGFTWLSRKWAGRAPEGKLLVRAYFSGEGASANEEELAKTAIADLERIVGPVPEPEGVWVYRWAAGMPQYTVGHLDRVRRIEEGVRRWTGLELAGAAYRGVGLPEVVRDGRAAAARIVDLLAARPLD